MTKKVISQLGENGLIKRIIHKRNKLLDNANDLLIRSYQDDASLIVNNSKYTVISTDMLIQHTHFPKAMSPYQMGMKIITVNVSDIISMNAVCDSIVVSMGLPSSMTIADFDSLVDGILDKCLEYNITLIGGDINQSDEIILSATAIGKVDSNITLQSTINCGDLIGVTGDLGTPACALDLLDNNSYSIEKSDKNEIIKSILEPDIPLTIVNELKNYPKLVTSMTDITDGLARELNNLFDKNENVGFEIEFDKVPYNKNIEVVANENNKSLNEYLFHFGEEFEMLLTLNVNEYMKNKNKLKDIHIIGKVTDENEITLIKNNEKKRLSPKGYEHLKE